MAITDFYNDTVSIYRRSYTKDVIGGRVESLALVTTTACRVNDLNGQDRAYLGIESDMHSVKIFCTPSATTYIYEGDIARVTYNGVQRDWSIKFVRRLHQKNDFHHYELVCEDPIDQAGV